MNGGSLGLRSGSYGALRDGVALPSMPVLVRKQSRMVLSGSREKERCLGWLFRIAGRRKVGILLLLLILAAVLSFITVAMSRDEDNSPDHESFLELRRQGTLGVTRVHSRIGFTRHPCDSFSIPSSPLFDVIQTGPRPCAVCYVPVEQAIMLMPWSPSASPVLENLSYVIEDNLFTNESKGGSIFGGHPSLQQRNEYFDIKESMTVHCGFVKGQKPGQGTGFDIEESDLFKMEQCHGVVVASANFGNYDIIQQPKNISPYAQKNACFYIFIDEETETHMKNSSILNENKITGLWRVVVVHNLPYVDARRNGKNDDYCHTPNQEI